MTMAPMGCKRPFISDRYKSCLSRKPTVNNLPKWRSDNLMVGLTCFAEKFINPIRDQTDYRNWDAEPHQQYKTHEP
jgi:hypothetical protein